MSESIHSSDWTGPPAGPAPEWERRLVAPGAVTAEQARTAQTRARERLALRTPEERRLMRTRARLAALLLFSPMLLFGARLFGGAATSDALVVDHAPWLAIWGMGVFGLAVLQLRRLFDPPSARTKTVLVLVLIQTAAVAVLYDYAAIASRRSAVSMAPERTYEIVRHRNRLPGYVVHQRADGSTIEGENIGTAVPYGTTCAEVQRLQGDYGFAWVKVVGKSPQPEHEIAWPIRREDCFSNKPLSSLRG